MATRKDTKFNKNNGYKDFTFSIPKLNNEVYDRINHAKNYNIPDNVFNTKVELPKK